MPVVPGSEHGCLSEPVSAQTVLGLPSLRPATSAGAVCFNLKRLSAPRLGEEALPMGRPGFSYSQQEIWRGAVPCLTVKFLRRQLGSRSGGGKAGVYPIGRRGRLPDDQTSSPRLAPIPFSIRWSARRSPSGSCLMGPRGGHQMLQVMHPVNRSP